MHVLLGLVKDLEMVNSRSPKEFVVFLIKANALVKLLLALLLPPPPPPQRIGMVMQVFGECLKLNPSWFQARQRLMEKFLPSLLVEDLELDFVMRNSIPRGNFFFFNYDVDTVINSADVVQGFSHGQRWSN
jgi:hypothetical protein